MQDVAATRLVLQRTSLRLAAEFSYSVVLDVLSPFVVARCLTVSIHCPVVVPDVPNPLPQRSGGSELVPRDRRPHRVIFSFLIGDLGSRDGDSGLPSCAQTSVSEAPHLVSAEDALLARIRVGLFEALLDAVQEDFDSVWPCSDGRAADVHGRYVAGAGGLGRAAVLLEWETGECLGEFDAGEEVSVGAAELGHPAFWSEGSREADGVELALRDDEGGQECIWGLLDEQVGGKGQHAGRLLDGELVGARFAHAHGSIPASWLTANMAQEREVASA